MFVGILQVELGIPGAFSLKDKRRVVKSELAKMRQKFGVAAAEVGDQDIWNRARIGVACVSNDTRHCESQMQHVLNELGRARDAVVLDSSMEVI